jgi:hypothetical protein
LEEFGDYHDMFLVFGQDKKQKIGKCITIANNDGWIMSD